MLGKDSPDEKVAELKISIETGLEHVETGERTPIARTEATIEVLRCTVNDSVSRPFSNQGRENYDKIFGNQDNKN